MIEERIEEEGPEIVEVEPEPDEPEERTSGRGRIEAPVEVSEQLTERARKLDIGDEEIAKNGGWRSNEYKDIFWLDLKQLCEFEEADIRIMSDKEFWAWFREFRTSEGMNRERGWASWKEQAGSWWDQHKPKNYLSKWWDDIGYKSDSELSRKLAVALKAVNTTVSVVNTSGKRYSVSFSDDTLEAPMSYTNFDERKVVVSPQPLLDSSLKQDDAIEIETGYGLHEASHVQYTEPIKDTLLKPTPLEPLIVSQRLLNIIEDARIEQKTSSLFPGFAPYFEKMLDYLWSRTKSNIPTQWGPTLEEKVNATLAAVRWPNEFEPIATQDDRLREEFDWSRNWVDRYLSGKIKPRDAIVEMLLHLREDVETNKQLDELTERERQTHGEIGKLTDEQFGDLMSKLRERLNSGKEIETCPSPHHGQTHHIKLTPEQAKELNQLVSWQLDLKDPIVTMTDMYGNSSGPVIAWMKPELNQNARDAYRPPTDLVGRLRGAFFFRKAAPQWSDRLLRNGNVDEEEIWRFGAGDYRIFEKKHTIDTPDTQVTLLVDMSGSMTGTRIDTAYELANVMLACLSTMKGVRVRVRGHTTRSEFEGGGRGESTIYRLWEQGDPVERLGLIDTMPHGWNYDGFAIGAVCEEMLAESKPHEDAVLIVLSDGKPNGRGFAYSGTPAMDHVRQVVTHYARLGVTTIQIAIDPEMRSADQERMYDHWIPFTKREELPQQLTKLLIKLFGGE